jgi:phage tail-like protein
MSSQGRPSVAESPAPPAASLVELRLVPEEVELLLRPEETGPRSERLRPMWHYTLSRPGALVSLQSPDDRQRLVRLSVQSDAPGWSRRWVRWTYDVRRVPESEGGDALEAQDVLADDESTLTLLVRPHEKRTATVEFQAVLDGQSHAGDHRFEVVATEVLLPAGREGAATTVLGLLRLRHPPASLLNYMPSIYRETLAPPRERHAPYEERPFFERFLRGFEDAMGPSQALVANLDRYFDSDAAPADFLPWLATWVSLVLDENWPVLKRRRLIQEAVELYRWRGTRRGLARYLWIYAGVVPHINDQPFTGMRLGPGTLLGRDTRLGDVPPHTFVVTLAVPDPMAINEQIVRDIIESEKPAHTAYEFRIVRRVAGED